VAEDWTVQTNLYPVIAIATKWVDLDCDGLMLIREGFGSDGTSFLEKILGYIPWLGKKLMRLLLKGSIGHDGIYYLFKIGDLPLSWRPAADIFARNTWISSGVYRWFADICLWALRKLGGTAALPENARPILLAE
jgi:hypothetical protein